MLDGLLGRGFASKCKSLIKLTTTRIDAIKRKRDATQRFLRKDIADLLANGLDINAFGRGLSGSDGTGQLDLVEGLLVELRLSSCYDFVEQACECILKHLSLMQKQSECPEESRMAVASLMFAAARFSDLPELRDLRDTFQEKFGNSLEYYANKEFIEYLASKPPALEKKVMLMKDIASEFLIKWDFKNFELRMSKPQKQLKTHGPSHNDNKSKLPETKESKYRTPSAERSSPVADRSDGSATHMHAHTTSRNCDVSKPDEDPQLHRRNHKHMDRTGDVPFQGKPGSNADQLNGGQKITKIQKYGDSSRTAECNGGNYKLQNGRENTALESDGPDPSAHRTQNLPTAKPLVRTRDKEVSLPDTSSDAVSVRKVQDEDKEKAKPPYNISIPPPYRKSRRTKSSSASLGSNEVPLDPSRGTADEAQSVLEGTQVNTNDPGNDRQVVAPAKAISHQEHHHGEDITGDTLPRRSSSRRRHLRLPPSHDDHGATEDTGVVRRRSSSRREKSRHDVGILFDEADGHHHQKDDEERMIDKLLLHYSHKPSSYDPEKVRHKMKADPSHQTANDTNRNPERRRRDTSPHQTATGTNINSERSSRNASHHQTATDSSKNQERRSRDGSRANAEVFPPPARSVSLPHDQTAHLEAPVKVFTRTASLQPARHVHPKLPDYDDLAARFAALKGKE